MEVGAAFHPELTGRENIYLNGVVLGMKRPEIRRKFDAIVDFAEIERFLDTPVKRYSSGMYVRLAFAVAAHLEPDILVVDEVLSVGDAQFQKKYLRRMEQAGKEDRTVLFVSHNMQAVLSLCNRGILLERGQIAAAGSAQDVVTAYRELGASNQTDRVWPTSEQALGNEFIRLRSARIRFESHSDGGQITIRTPFWIEVTYDADVHADAFFLAVELRTIYGDFIFGRACSPTTFEPGTYRSACMVPGDLLNDGLYAVDVVFVRDGAVTLFRAQELLTFEVYDVEREAGTWMGKIPGPIRPRLTWETERISTYAPA